MVEAFAYFFLIILVFAGLYLAAKAQIEINRRNDEKKSL